MRQFLSFPTREEVLIYAELFKHPERTYVTAIRPTWRVVWIFDRGTVGW